MVELDYKQMEVRVLAVASQDKQLLADIAGGLDMHSMSATFGTTWSYDHIVDQVGRKNKDMIAWRKIAKRKSFLVQYGGTAFLLAEQTGCSKRDAQDFIDGYYKRYPRVKQWQEELIEEVDRESVVGGRRTHLGQPAREYTWVSPLGTRHTFIQDDSPDWKSSDVSFSPTKIKNYPIQGMSAHLIMVALGMINRTLTRDDELRDKALLVNTIYDSVILDCHVDVLDEAIGLVKQIMEEGVITFIENVYGVSNFTVALPVDVSLGMNWAEMDDYEPQVGVS